MALFDVSNEVANQRAAGGLIVLIITIALCVLISRVFGGRDKNGSRKDYWP
jgi:hypothetical protein